MTIRSALQRAFSCQLELVPDPSHLPVGQPRRRRVRIQRSVSWTLLNTKDLVFGIFAWSHTGLDAPASDALSSLVDGWTMNLRYSETCSYEIGCLLNSNAGPGSVHRSVVRQLAVPVVLGVKRSRYGRY
jgi:hypothetical protein